MRNYFQEIYSNSQKTWSKINEVLHRQKQFENIFLDETVTVVSSHNTFANKFNDSFTNVGKKLLENMGETNSKFQDCLKNPNQRNLFMKGTYPEEVNKYLNNLDMKKVHFSI